MNYVRNFESFKNSKKESLNEEFIGGLLKNIMPDWLKNINVKNKRSIDKSLEQYRKDYESANKELSSILDSKDDIDKDKLKNIQSALLKKRELIKQKLDNSLRELTKDNEKSKNYSIIKRNSIEIALIDSELKSYQDMGLEKTEYVEKLKENSNKAKLEKEDNEKKLKSIKSEPKGEIKSQSDVLVGDILLYTNKDGNKSIVKVLEDGKLKRVSVVVNKEDYNSELKKAEDQRNTIGLFKEEEGGDSFSPIEWSNLERISKESEKKFT
jgi:hypothetical protein